MDSATIIALALISLLITWAIAAFLDTRAEKKRELEAQKALERLGLRKWNSYRDDPD